MHLPLPLCFLGTLVLSGPGHGVESASHYEQPPCQFDEVQGEVQGASGYVCAPRCEESTYNCATDVPIGSSARPQCMLQDGDRGAFCGLLCQVDSQCPSGSRCQQIKQAEIGLCLYPISFADWAKQVATKKLAVGWPTKPGGAGVTNVQVSKTYQSLQNLKQKYIIDDGDQDMIVLKELLSSLTGPNAATPLTGVGNPMGGYGASTLSPSAAMNYVSNAMNPVASSPGSNSGSGALGAWKHDIRVLEDDMSMGVGPGLMKMAHDTEWNIEHIQHQNAAAALLRGLILAALAYVGVGSLIKYYSLEARGIDMIPHVGFWMEYPALVSDGVTYAQILIGSKTASTYNAPHLDSGIARGGARGGAGAFESFPSL